MSRNIKRHPVELLIIAYLKKLSKTSNIRSEKNILDKLSKIIGAVLEDPCCTDTVVNFNTPKETYIIVSVVNALNGVDVRKWRESLERAKAAVDAKVNNPCCLVTINYDVRFFNTYTDFQFRIIEDGVTRVEILTEVPQTGSIQVKPGAAMQLQIGHNGGFALYDYSIENNVDGVTSTNTFAFNVETIPFTVELNKIYTIKGPSLT
jgi:hypothetical protein